MKGDLVSDWHISDEPSLSHHRCICFQIGSTAIIWVAFWDPKRSNWESYKDDLRTNPEIIL
jgi:hypothetical protein